MQTASRHSKIPHPQISDTPKLLTPRSNALLEKVTVAQLVKKFNPSTRK
jgi:hypothetical protein